MFLSVSGLRKLRKCPHLWELTYITKAKGRVVNTRNFMHGGIIHKIIKAWFDAGRPPAKAFFSPALVKTEHDTYIRTNHVKWLRTETRTSHYDEAVAKADKTAKALEDIPFESFGECQTEVRINANIDGNDYWRIGGIIDLWLVSEREVYDFKISKDKKWFDMAQVLFYCFLLSIHTNRMHAKGGIIAPLLKNPLDTSFIKVFTIEDFREFRQELKSEFNRIFKWLKERKEGKHFPTNKKDENCWDCPYKNAGCQAWSLGAQHYGIWAGKGAVGFFDRKD